MRELKRQQPGFADLEFWRQVRPDPVLQQISMFLDAQGAVPNLISRQKLA